MAKWTGFADGILAAVAGVIQNQKAALGLQAVRVGEARGWASPSAFVSLGRGGVRARGDSGRYGVRDYVVPITVAVVLKDMTQSMDTMALQLAQACLDALEDAAPLPNVHEYEVVSLAVEKYLEGNGANGAYLTAGVLEVDFYAAHASQSDGRPG